MSELRKANSDQIYFITMTVVGWIDVFTRKELADIILKNLNYCIANKGLEVFNYVIMPNHIHMICRCAENKKLSDLLRDFKSYSAKKILEAVTFNKFESRKRWMMPLFELFALGTKQNKYHMFWQKTNYPIELYSQKVIDQKINYIHNNPVKAGLVTDAESYRYSSLNPFNEVKLSEW